MRIISGSLRGTKLYTLDGLNTRPTLDRVKESLFNIINNKLENAIVLDLFAGSGALSLEALSRGARTAHICDYSKEAMNIIKKNIDKTRMTQKTNIYNYTYEKTLQKLKEDKIKFDIIFLDPPYESKYAEDASKKIIEYNLLNEDGIIIIETDNKDKVIQSIDKLLIEIYDIRKYGRVSLLFLKRKGFLEN